MRYFRQLIGSFHRPDAYEAARTGQGWGLVYALFIVALTTLAGVLWLVAYFHSAVLLEQNGKPPLLKQMVTQIAQQWPEMMIEQDRIVMHGPTPMPYEIHVAGEIFGEEFSGAFITIDTTGKTTATNMQTPLLITATEIITKGNDSKRELRPLGELFKSAQQPLHIDEGVILHAADDLYDAIASSIWVLYAIMVPIIWGIFTGLFFIGRMVMLLGLGVIGLVLSRLGGRAMGYMESVRLASLAYTPVAVLSALGFAFALRTPSTLVLFALGTLMLFVGLHVTRQEPRA